MTAIYALFICSLMPQWDGAAWVKVQHCEPSGNEVYTSKTDCDRERLFFARHGQPIDGGRWVCMEINPPTWHEAR